ncbi:MAG: hypothetical protein ABIS38_02360 [Sphingomicrobium sp.]
MILATDACPAPPPPPPPPEPVFEPEIAAGSAAPNHFERSSGPAQPVRSRARPARSTAPPALPFTDPQVEPDPSDDGSDDSLVEDGVAAFVKPAPMKVDRWAIIEFAAGPNVAKLGAATEGQALTAPTAIYVAKTMKVTLLNDPAFEIKAKGEAVQDSGLDRTATWLWDVRPKVGGVHSLNARVEVLRALPGGGFETIEQYTRKVDVTVTVGALGAIDQAASVGDKLTGLFSSWQKAVTALVALVVAVGVLMWRLGLRKRKPVA